MFDIDFRRMMITIALLGCAVGGLVAAGALLAWPHVWAWIKPLLHAATA